ncbi:PHD finger protein 21B [Etheostoma spectabile]|uniref:PHD finger protein 21B n=1 Tax=Etheostoma spectabile TaxID=54343 RepID=UPI0013AEB0FB|nr:PHD finger protein 21B-like [Etheostoma spectabile]
MELQGLQEALKVEIQCHQDGELKRQLHDRRITALSDKQNQTLCKGLNELQNGQKLAVRSCPVASLIKPPGPGIAISVVPAKAPVSMVTAHINGQKAASSESLQTSPINLQTGARGGAAGVHTFSSRRAGELSPSQMLGTLPAVAHQGASSQLPALAGRTSSHYATSGQAKDPDPRQPPPQSVSAAAAPRPAEGHGRGQSEEPGPHVAHRQQHLQPQRQSDASPPPAPPRAPTAGPGSGSPVQHASAGPGWRTPSSPPPPPPVIIIQPQAPSSTEGSPGAQADLPSQEVPPAPKSPKSPKSLKSPTQKKDEDPELQEQESQNTFTLRR